MSDCSLIIYSYFVTISGLKDRYCGVRIFQQENINLAAMEKTLNINRATIKKYLEQLESRRLIIFKPNYEEDNSLSFNERWKIRNKHKECYYEIPRPYRFIKIPKETIEKLIKKVQIKELTYKIYLTLINFQEFAVLNGHNNIRFTCKKIKTYLGKKDTGGDINDRIKKALIQLKELNLIDLEFEEGHNSKGAPIPIFCLKGVNFYINE